MAINHFTGCPWAASKWLLSSCTGDEYSYFWPKFVFCNELEREGRWLCLWCRSSRREKEWCFISFVILNLALGQIYLHTILSVYLLPLVAPIGWGLPHRFRHFVLSHRTELNLNKQKTSAQCYTILKSDCVVLAQIFIDKTRGHKWDFG